jgi:hypothetical protein
MTDTPAESAEAPLTPSPIEELCNHVVQQWCDGVDLETAVRGAIEESVRAAIAARDAEVVEKAIRIVHEEHVNAMAGAPTYAQVGHRIEYRLRALLSEGKPSK